MCGGVREGEGVWGVREGGGGCVVCVCKEERGVNVCEREG